MEAEAKKTEQTRGCRGCTETVRIAPDRLERLVSIAMEGRPAASEEEYARRLAICGSCCDLQYGTTCRHCGCLIAVRARLKEAVCPFPCASKWN